MPTKVGDLSNKFRMSRNQHIFYLVGGLEHYIYFSIYWEQYFQLTFIFFRGVETIQTDFMIISGMYVTNI